MNGETRLLSALIAGPKTSGEIGMPRETRKKWAGILQDLGFLTYDSESKLYDLTTEGRVYAVKEKGLKLPPVKPYFDLSDAPEFKMNLHPRRRRGLFLREWIGLTAAGALAGGLTGYYGLHEMVLSWIS